MDWEKIWDKFPRATTDEQQHEGGDVSISAAIEVVAEMWEMAGLREGITASRNTK